MGTLAGCARGDAGPAPRPPGPGPSPSEPAGADVDAVTALLTRRAGALVAGDEGAWSATVDRAGAEEHQARAFLAARALGLSRLGVDDVRLDPATTVGEPARRATALLRYRIGDLDRADRSAGVALGVVRRDGRWLVVSEEPSGPGAAAPWLAVPGLAVRRGDHALVAGTVPVESLAAHVEVVDRALPELRRHWPRTPQRVLVLAPSSAREADLLLGRDGGSATQVGATTEGPTDAAGRATGDRVVLDPGAFGRLTPSGRDVVLTHELVHVAVRSTVPGRAAAWLSEGYADHVGYRRADVPVARLLAPLVAEVRAGRLPADLPRLDALAPSSGSIEVPYLAAWQAVELLVAAHGEAAVRRLVVEGSATGTDADAEVATDRALTSVLGLDRAGVVRQWRARLTDLAG